MSWLKDNISPLLAVIIVVAGLGMLIIGMTVFQWDVKIEIVAFLMAIIGFYFGSSVGSRNKDELFKLPSSEEKK